MSLATSMRALRKSGLSAQDTVVVDAPVPEPGPGEVLLRVEACGLCGSDIHAWRTDPGYEWVIPPVVLGHEMVGTVAQVGTGVDDWSVGERAVVVSIQGCLECSECQAGRTNRCRTRRVIGLSYDGGFAEYVRVAVGHLVRVPADLPAAVAAAIEPMSVAAHATLTIGQAGPGQRVVVTGAGFVGIACALLARHAGADVTLYGAGRDAASRLPAAASLGLATAVAEGASFDEPDLWIEASGSQIALANAVLNTRPGGRISVVAMYAHEPIADISQLVRRELEVRGVYASVRAEYEYVMPLLHSREIVVDPLLETFALESAVDALEAAAESRTLKPIVIP